MPEMESQNTEVNADTDVGLFIETIQHYEFLYNKSHKDYKNKNIKDAAWKEMSAILNSNVEDLMKMWKNLRDRFVKENKTTSGSEAPETTWPFYKHMLFYTKFTKPRKTYTVGSLSKPNSRGSSAERACFVETHSIFSPGSGVSEEETASLLDVPTTSGASIGTPKAQPGQKRKRKALEGQDEVSELVNIAKRLAQKVPETSNSINAKFAEYVSASLDELTKEEAKEKRNKILEVLNA